MVIMRRRNCQAHWEPLEVALARVDLSRVVRDDVTGCAVPQSNRPYSEWTRDVDDYPSEEACNAAKERQREAVEWHRRAFRCITQLGDSRVCVPEATLTPPLPRKEFPPEKVERVRIR